MADTQTRAHRARPRLHVLIQHADPAHVTATEVPTTTGDLVSLTIGEHHAEVEFLDDLESLILVVAAQADKLAAVKAAREAGAG